MPHEEAVPIQYARAHLPRLDRLLSSSILTESEHSQLLSARVALENPDLHRCVGLDNMLRTLDALELRLRLSRRN